MSVIRDIKKADWSKVIAVLEIILGGTLLIYEMRDFSRLPTVAEVDALWGGIVDLAKYKESTYKLMFFYSLVFAAGLTYFKSKKISWIINQALGVFVILSSIVFLVLSVKLAFDFTDYIVTFLMIGAAILAELVIWKIKPRPDTSAVKTTAMGIAAGLISFAVYVLLMP